MPKPTNRDIALHRQFLQREKTAERKYERQYYKWIQDCNRAAATAYLNNQDINEAIDNVPVEPIFERLYNELTIREAIDQYKLLVPEEAELLQTKDIIDDLAGVLSQFQQPNRLITLWRGLLGEFMNIRISDRITEVTETTKDRVSKLIEQGLNEGEGAEEIARRLRRDTKFSRNRSRAISRTESVRAMNQGKYLAAFSSPYATEKKWLPTIDSRTRPSHADMYDREYIDLEASFWLANAQGMLEQAQYPCDSSLSASNSVNCRCSLLLRSKRGPDGRLIRKNNTI